VIIQLVISAFVLILCWLIGWFFPYTFGLVFTWVGALILLVVGFILFSGILSGAEDLTAYSYSGAGKMLDHIINGQKAKSPRVVFMIFGLLNGFIPLLMALCCNPYSLILSSKMDQTGGSDSAEPMMDKSVW
jgi:hypothetical protein